MNRPLGQMSQTILEMSSTKGLLHVEGVKCALGHVKIETLKAHLPYRVSKPIIHYQYSHAPVLVNSW